MPTEPENLSLIRAWAKTTLQSCNELNEKQLRDALTQALTHLAVLLNDLEDRNHAE